MNLMFVYDDLVPSFTVPVKLGRLSLGSAKVVPRGGIDDLLSSAEGGKNDYDWLLTPPGTPLFPSSEANESQPPSVAPRTGGLGRSISTTKSSRLSVSQSDSYHSSRPARSSSVTRSSSSASHLNTYSSNRSPSSMLNTSSASVSSYTRPSSPITRSRPSTPSSRSTGSRPSTPSRVRPSPSSVSLPEKSSRPSQTSRPSTPSSRPQTPANMNPPAARSRPSTPTRRTPLPCVTSSSVTSTSAGRAASNGRMSAPSSRPSSPSPRVRSTQQPVVPPDFSLDTPPNLRTTLPDRPLSAGRSRPGAAINGKPTPESGNMHPRRNPSPIVTRGRVSEPPGRSRIHSNGHASDISESRRSIHGSDPGARRALKPSSTATDSTGFGRTISKKSIDMAIRHMDIRNGAGGSRPLSGTTLFPQSIRGGSMKPQSHNARSSSSTLDVNGNGHLHNGQAVENGHYGAGRSNHQVLNEGRQFGRLGEGDMYESSRYDAMLLKEDVKNMNWLHSVDDDKFDQASIFDHGFEYLPEPFSPL
ncbi:hypothetical protein LINGRAHAP2_LOCUS4720 [Linum grandiflorum]